MYGTIKYNGILLTPGSREAHLSCVSIPGGGNSGIRLLAHHDTSADRSRPETEDWLLKFEQSSSGARMAGGNA